MSDLFLLHDHLVMHLPMGIVVWQLHHLEDLSSFEIVEINPVACEILGIGTALPKATVLSMLNQQMEEPFPAFLRVEPPSVYADVVRSQQSCDLGEICYRDNQGVLKTYSIQAFPLPQQRVAVLMEDISDRKLAQETLRQWDQKLQFHIQQTPIAVIEWDLEGNILSWNPAAEAIFGYSVTLAVGQKIMDLVVPPEAHPQFEQSWRSLLSSKSSDRMVSSNLTQRGKTVICEWHNTPILDEFQTIISIMALVQDITQRQENEKQLLASEMRYRRLFETSQDGILILDAETGIIRDVNPFLLKLLGYPQTSLLGKKLWDLGLLEDRLLSQKTFQTLQQEGYIRYENLPLKTARGEAVEVEFISTVYWVGNKQVIQCNVRDIGDRKRIERERVIFNTRLEQSNRELQDFAFVASHDLQEPLRKIQAFGDRLKSRCLEQLTPEGQDYLQRMQSAAQRMQILINDLLTFSRVTTKAKPFETVDLNAIARQVLSDLEVQIQQKQAQVIVNSLPTLDADPTQMHQLFQNLISNALKFNQPQVPPQIEIQAEVLALPLPETVQSSEVSGLCEIAIVDNGIGFEEKYLDRIFTIFQRLHGRSEFEGTGIGLAICRKIVERHSGSITAISHLGRGSTFMIRLPLKQPFLNSIELDPDVQ